MGGDGEETSETNEKRTFETDEKNSEKQPLNPENIHHKPPTIEVHLFKQGKGPIDVFQSKLGGWEQDQLEVRDILDKYALKSIFAFNQERKRAAPIRFHPKNGRSLLSYTDGSVIYVDGEPKDSLVQPITKIIVGVAVILIFITFVSREAPTWLANYNFKGMGFPPWLMACAVILFTRMRKRTGNLLKKFGW